MLTKQERAAKKVFDQEIKRWRQILLIDPIWTIRAEVAEDEDMDMGSARVNIGISEYYVADIEISRCLLSLEGEDLKAMAKSAICHELLHIATADYQRAAIVASGDNDQLGQEIAYRYEQFVSRLSMVLLEYEDKLEEMEIKHAPPTKGSKSTK